MERTNFWGMGCIPNRRGSKDLFLKHPIKVVKATLKKFKKPTVWVIFKVFKNNFMLQYVKFFNEAFCVFIK